MLNTNKTDYNKLIKEMRQEALTLFPKISSDEWTITGNLWATNGYSLEIFHTLDSIAKDFSELKDFIKETNPRTSLRIYITFIKSTRGLIVLYTKRYTIITLLGGYKTTTSKSFTTSSQAEFIEVIARFKL